MKQKNLIASVYLKNGEAVSGFDAQERVEDIANLVKMYNDSGIDKLLIFDLSDNDTEHEQNLKVIRELNRNLEIPVCAGGNINRVEDIKKLLYAGCNQVMLNSFKKETAQLAEEGCRRFGKEKIALTLKTVDILFKHRVTIEEHVSELIILNQSIVENVSNVTEIPYLVMQDKFDLNRWTELLKQDNVLGIFGEYLNCRETNIMNLKTMLDMNGIETKKFESAINFETFKLNSDALIPVIVQDYQTMDVLMLAYMNQEAYTSTLNSGKMTYYSRSRKKIWVKGETSGHFQYVKSLTLDCDSDTILAKVSQVGPACHTGEPSCFFQELVKKNYIEKNPQKVFESVYAVIEDRKKNPKDGSYTNYLFDKGIDKILKKVGEEATEIVIASKNTDMEEIKYEISDFLYHVMVLMVEKGVTWDDISQELSRR